MDQTTRNNRYIRTADHVGRPIASGVGIPSGGHRGAKMRSDLIFPCLTKSTTMKNLFQPLLLLIAGATQKELARQVPPRKQLPLYGFTDREFPQVLMGK